MCTDDHGEGCDLGRRDFLKAGAVSVAGLGAIGNAGTGKQPPTRVLDDPRTIHGPVTFTHNGQPGIGGYLARPRAEGQHPAVLVVAGAPISEEYIPNTCAALALAGFVGLAPDIFHVVPESARTLAEMRAAIAHHSDGDVVEDLFAGIEYLRAQPFVKPGGMGVLGFCYGGRMAMLLGARARDLDAVAAYHPGTVFTAAEIARLSVPVQIHCGLADEDVSLAQVRSLEAMLRAQHTPVEVNLYPGAKHGFLAYTRPENYDAQAGALSWSRTTKFLSRYLKEK
jgi:carboxymethylenebutenolidase